MGSFSIPGSFLSVLLVWTLSAYACEGIYFTGAPNQVVQNPTNTTASVLGARTTIVQFLTFTAPGIDRLMTLALFFLVILPWLIVLIAVIISLIPFT